MNQKDSPLYGLVLTGGKSTRMQKDKASISYHGKMQAEYCYEFLSEFCDRVFISNRKEQAKENGQKGYPQIHDLVEYLDRGPITGILSAMTQYPRAAWLVLACDLPFVTKQTISDLLDQRNLQKKATAYMSIHDSLPEPLCAIYELGWKEKALDFMKEGISCPRKMLINSDVELLNPSNDKALDNVNNPDEYTKAVEIIKKTRESSNAG